MSKFEDELKGIILKEATESMSHVPVYSSEDEQLSKYMYLFLYQNKKGDPKKDLFFEIAKHIGQQYKSINIKLIVYSWDKLESFDNRANLNNYFRSIGFKFADRQGITSERTKNEVILKMIAKYIATVQLGLKGNPSEKKITEIYNELNKRLNTEIRVNEEQKKELTAKKGIMHTNILDVVSKVIDDEDEQFKKAGQFRKMDEELGLQQYAFKINQYIKLTEDPKNTLENVAKEKEQLLNDAKQLAIIKYYHVMYIIANGLKQIDINDISIDENNDVLYKDDFFDDKIDDGTFIKNPLITHENASQLASQHSQAFKEKGMTLLKLKYPFMHHLE